MRESPLMTVAQYLNSDASTRWARLVLIAASIALLLVGAWTLRFAYATVTAPLPLEYREGAAQLMTQLLLEGRNPFSPENQPLGMNNYGIVYGLAVLPLAALFSNTLLVHRLVTLVFVLACFALTVTAARRTGADLVASLAAGELVAIALAALGGLGAFPSSMGTFFFLAAVLIPWMRSFDRKGLALSAISGCIAFYTKPYFVLAWVIVAAYVLLFVSRRSAPYYAGLCAGLLLVSAAFIRMLLPLYFFDVLVCNTAIATRDMAHMLAQLVELLREFYPAVLSLALLALAALSGLRWKTIQRGSPGLANRLAGSPGYFAFVFALSLLAFVLVLGPHTGTILNYAHQLLIAPLLLWLLSALRPRSRIGLIVVALFTLNTVTFARARLAPALLTQSRESALAWVRLQHLVESSDRVLNSPVLVSEMIHLGMPLVDSGLTDDFFWPGSYPEMAPLWPSSGVIEGIRSRYLDDVRAAVEHHEYDRIIVTNRLDYFFDEALVSKYYRRVATLSVDMPQPGERWTLIVWEPR